MDEIKAMLLERGLTDTQIQFLGKLLDGMRRFHISGNTASPETVVNKVLDTFVGKE